MRYYIIVNPEDKVAKVYELKEGRYAKLCDATDETVEFAVDACKDALSFDFSKIW